MTLPNGEQAIVPAGKVRNYLLSPHHLLGAHKAVVFARLGFRRRNWRDLRRALKRIAMTGEALHLGVTEYGQKFLIRGILRSAQGDSVAFVTIWMIPAGEDTPRFVTAYPET